MRMANQATKDRAVQALIKNLQHIIFIVHTTFSFLSASTDLSSAAQAPSLPCLAPRASLCHSLICFIGLTTRPLE
ncbi:hypothetical protein SLA2020_125760 [Shorea laevis]